MTRILLLAACLATSVCSPAFADASHGDVCGDESTVGLACAISRIADADADIMAYLPTRLRPEELDALHGALLDAVGRGVAIYVTVAQAPFESHPPHKSFRSSLLGFQGDAGAEARACWMDYADKISTPHFIAIDALSINIDDGSAPAGGPSPVVLRTPDALHTLMMAADTSGGGAELPPVRYISMDDALGLSFFLSENMVLCTGGRQ